jgi:hypothetical protein
MKYESHECWVFSRDVGILETPIRRVAGHISRAYPLKGIRLSALGQSAGAVGILSTKGNKLSRVDPNVALTVSNVCPRIPGGIAGETVSRQIPDADKSREL